MPTPLDFEAILARRDEVFRQLASLGDLRPGSLVARFRKCGKPNCHCAAEGAPGHGPSWSLTRGVRGKTVTRVIPADAVEETRAQIEECRCLRRLTGELIEVSEQLCNARLQTADAEARIAGKKKPARSSSPR